MNWSTLRIAIVGPLPPPAGGMAGQTQQLAELSSQRRSRCPSGADERVRIGRHGSPAFVACAPSRGSSATLLGCGPLPARCRSSMSWPTVAGRGTSSRHRPSGSGACAGCGSS